VEARLRFRRRVSLVSPLRAEPVRDERGTSSLVRHGPDIETAKGRKTSYGGANKSSSYDDAIPRLIVVLDPAGTPSPRINRRSTIPVSRWRPCGHLFSRAGLYPEDVEELRGRTAEASRRAPFANEQRARRRTASTSLVLIQYNPLRDEMEGCCIGTRPTTSMTGSAPEQSMQNENQALRDEIDHSSMFEEIVALPGSFGACSLRWHGWPALTYRPIR